MKRTFLCKYALWSKYYFNIKKDGLCCQGGERNEEIHAIKKLWFFHSQQSFTFHNHSHSNHMAILMLFAPKFSNTFPKKIFIRILVTSIFGLPHKNFKWEAIKIQAMFTTELKNKINEQLYW